MGHRKDCNRHSQLPGSSYSRAESKYGLNATCAPGGLPRPTLIPTQVALCALIPPIRAGMRSRESVTVNLTFSATSAIPEGNSGPVCTGLSRSPSRSCGHVQIAWHVIRRVYDSISTVDLHVRVPWNLPRGMSSLISMVWSLNCLSIGGYCLRLPETSVDSKSPI